MDLCKVLSELLSLVLILSIYFVSTFAQLQRSIFPYRVEKEWTNHTCHLDAGQQLPTWLKGTFLRQTCGAFGDTKKPDISPPLRIMHFFDCIPMAVAYRFDGENGVTFSNRYYRTHNYKIWEKHDFKFENSQIAWLTFFSPFDYGQYHKWRNEFNESQGYYAGSPSVEFWRLDSNHYEAVDESPHGLHLDLYSLESLGPFPFNDDFEEKYRGKGMQGLINNPAHPAYDDDGVVWSVVGHWMLTSPVSGIGKASYLIYSIRNLERVLEGEHVVGEFNLAGCRGRGDVPYPRPQDALGLLHSLPNTRRYLIIPQSSYTLNYCGTLIGESHESILREGSKNGLFYRYVSFRREVEGKMIIFDKTIGKVIKVVPIGRGGFFSSHQLNTYEVDGKIIADMVTYNNAVYEVLTVDKMIRGYAKDDTRLDSKVERIEIDVDMGTFTRRPLFNGDWRHLEFPQINNKRRGLPYTYVYMLDQAYSPHSSVIKFNVSSGEEVSRWQPEKGVYPGEPYFVPRPDGDDEDDGYVLVGLTDANKMKGSVVVLDGSTLEEVSRLTAPELTPLGLHNQFYSDFIMSSATTLISSSNLLLILSLHIVNKLASL